MWPFRKKFLKKEREATGSTLQREKKNLTQNTFNNIFYLLKNTFVIFQIYFLSKGT